MKRFIFLLLVVAAGISAPRATAHEETYFAALNGATVEPANASPGTGFATIVFDLDLFVVHLEVNFGSLTGTVTAAHIHAGTPMPFTGTAPAATPTLPAFPIGVTGGTYTQTIDFTLQSSYDPVYFAANGGNVALVSSAFYQAVSSGRAYLQIETSAFPNGEIRGFAAVPEPSAAALFALGLAVAVVIATRRRHNSSSL